MCIDYEDFFEKIKKFKEIQEQQKKRGLNDFNLLTTVRKYHDEVYLHSAMIGALLNPHGLHYQKTLFLELFLKEIGLHEWGLDLENVSVQVEYKDIDLYITDGVKHIIIENKIWAEDQECQIIRYINIIIEENQETFKNLRENDVINDDFLRVIYLTAQAKDVPDEHVVSEGYISFCGGKDKLKKCSNKDHTKALVKEGLKNYEVRYQKNDYKDILRWLKNSKKQVSNITNLNEAIQQYMDVVKMVNKTYEGNVMSLKEYITDNDLGFGLLKSVVSEYKNMIDIAKEQFISSLKESMKENEYGSKIDKNEPLKIPLTDEIALQIVIESNKVFISIYKKDWQKIGDKNIVLRKLENITVNEKKFEDPIKWKNVYATIDIMDVESKEFLEVDKNITMISKAIHEIIEQLKI